MIVVLRDYKRIFNARTGALAGAVLAPVAFGLWAMANPEFKEYPLERIVEIAAVTLPINICIASAVAHEFGYFMNSINPKGIRNNYKRICGYRPSL